MARIARLELERRVADWAGSEFTADSRSHVSVYRTPDRAVGRRAAPTFIHRG